ncbi:putative B3 domain-containing protein [Cardamine amara subsp. amara]|uniref:B3 domain-containing protein n=1 Tax=Cardamine amara subsp. amara TaxID=228776 RepID=A0ABD1AG31_CARAN
MDKSDVPRVSKPKICSKFDMLVYVAGLVYDQQYGPREEDKEIEARIFKNTIPRKKRSRSRSDRSSYSPKAWMRLIEEDISKLQNPNSESESSSCVTQSKKLRLVNVSKEEEEEEEEEERRVFKKRKIVRRLEPKPTQTTTSLPPPPEWLLNVMMREGNGYNPKLISARKLYKTDLNRIQARLSVPFKQVVNPDFLTEDETRIIDEQAMKIRKEGVSVDFVDPLMNKYVIDLRKWPMSGNWYYVFVDSWNDVVAANRFKVDEVFHLWSFRSGSGKLCFALVPPSPATSSTDVSHGVGVSTSGECSHGCSSFDDSQNV